MNAKRITLIVSAAILLISACTNTEDLLMGTWKMVDYQSTETVAPEQIVNYQNNVEALKRAFVLDLYDDYTFSRKGFAPNGEVGTWFLQDDGTTLMFMTPQNEQQGWLNIEDISSTELVLYTVQPVTRFSQDTTGLPIELKQQIVANPVTDTVRVTMVLDKVQY